MIGAYATWQLGRHAISRCSDLDKRHFSLVHCIAFSKTIALTSTSYCRKLPSKRTSPVTLRCGKTVNKQAPSWWKTLADTWYRWFNKLRLQKSWVVSGTWRKKMHFFEQAKLTQLCVRQHIRKFLNQLNHLLRKEASPPQFAVPNGTCHHRCIPLWHTVHLEWNPRPWHPHRRISLFNKHSVSARHHLQP